METFSENCELDEFIDGLLIDCVKQRPSLYYTDLYDEADEREWDEIQRKFGIQKSWLKKRWRTIRNDHRRITIYNHTHSNKVPIHKMAKHLNFLIIDLNGANKMNFEDLTRPKSESFHVTKEMLDNCDINESVTFESISVPKVYGSRSVPKSNVKSKLPGKIVETHTEPKDQNELAHNARDAGEVNKKNDNHIKEATETRNANSHAEQRCEEEIFGEYVIAMLKKLPADEKKRVQKEIMNILL